MAAGALKGKRIAITSARGHALEAIKKLRRMGAIAKETPLVRITPMSFSLPDFSSFDCVIFTSHEGVEAVIKKTGKGKFLRAMRGKKVFAIGPKTASSLTGLGIRPSVPKEYESESLGRHVAKKLGGGSRVLAFRSSRGSEVLRKSLKKSGIYAREIKVYRIEPVRRKTKADIIFVTSRTAARALRKSAASVISIGPYTTRALRKRGIRPVEAKEHTLDGMIRTILDYLHGKNKS